jgi:hypothetical protein
MKVSYPPATKCAHALATGAPVATGAPSSCFDGNTSPVSRDCVSTVCLDCELVSPRPRGFAACSKIIYRTRGGDAGDCGQDSEVRVQILA